MRQSRNVCPCRHLQLLSSSHPQVEEESAQWKIKTLHLTRIATVNNEKEILTSEELEP